MTTTPNGGFPRLRSQLDDIQEALRRLGLDGWLLYDLHARNAVAGGLLGLGDLSRRYFVLVPARGEPFALTHGVEPGPWQEWPWPKESYTAWRQLDAALGRLVSGKRLAMEISEGDAVPAVDHVPAGVLDLVRSAGAEVVSSAELITLFYSRWSREGLDSHRRAADVLALAAKAAFAHLGAALAEGQEVTEGGLKSWVLELLAARGCGAGADCIVANGPHAANPHYDPGATGAPLRRGDLVLLDLWAKESEDAVYADQTWMAFLGERVPERVAELFAVIRDARDAGVSFLRERWAAGAAVEGREVDDVVRGVVAARGYGPAFIHRTGHSIDRATHGMGPNIDNLETRDTRLLIPGVGFSIEPGIYLADDIGLRTEINVYIGADGPEVTPPEPQSEVIPVFAGG